MVTFDPQYGILYSNPFEENVLISLQNLAECIDKKLWFYSASNAMLLTVVKNNPTVLGRKALVQDGTQKHYLIST